MSYPRTLDEIPSSELINELILRQKRLALGQCPYCAKPLDIGGGVVACTCRFSDVLAYHRNMSLMKFVAE